MGGGREVLGERGGGGVDEVDVPTTRRCGSGLRASGRRKMRASTTGAGGGGGGGGGGVVRERHGGGWVGGGEELGGWVSSRWFVWFGGWDGEWSWRA